MQPFVHVGLVARKMHALTQGKGQDLLSEPSLCVPRTGLKSQVCQLLPERLPSKTLFPCISNAINKRTVNRHVLSVSPGVY